MPFTSTQEQDVLRHLADHPDLHLRLPSELYQSDGAIRISRNRLRLTLTHYLFEQVFGRRPGGFLLRDCDDDRCQNPRHFHESPSSRLPAKPARNVGGPNAATINRRKKKCPHGHRYTPENTYIWHDAKGEHRKCAACAIARQARKRAAARAQSKAAA